MRLCGYPTVEKIDDTSSRYDTIPACDRRTSGSVYIPFRLVLSSAVTKTFMYTNEVKNLLQSFFEICRVQVHRSLA